MKLSYWYLATPYSKYADGLEEAFKAACRQAGVLIRAGVPVFSPIAHTHPIAAEFSMDPLDLELWLRVDRPMMEAAHGLIICRLSGWQESTGVEHERQFFADRGRPVYYMDPGRVPVQFHHDPRQVAYEAQRTAWRESHPTVDGGE
jgi:hypothetical protein